MLENNNKKVFRRTACYHCRGVAAIPCPYCGSKRRDCKICHGDVLICKVCGGNGFLDEVEFPDRDPEIDDLNKC